MKKCLLGKTIDQLKEVVNSLGEKSFRANQLSKSLFCGLNFSEMTDISKNFREILSNNFIAQPVEIIKSVKSIDGTEKFLFAMQDGNVIEGVLMRYKYGNTLCVSTQIGCRMNCAFCASGLDGLIRNLTAEEILGEVVSVNKYLGGGLKEDRMITNVVLMGSGEPLDNYDEVIRFVKLLSSESGLNISSRNVSLSTAGLVPNIYKLAEENLSLNLTISLHSPFDEERKKIMPIAKTYKISQIMDACENYFKKTRRRYIFEYVLILNENDSDRHAEGLIKLMKGRPCHVNLIRLNEVKEKSLKAATDKKAYQFLGLLEKAGISATLRRRMGSDIDGACGQLRRRYLEDINKT